MNKPKVTMTSIEAAALVLSEGKSTDPDEAELIAAGKLLDPDKLHRAALRRAMGFDYSVLHDEKLNKWVVRDDELGIKVLTPMDQDEMVNAERIARACMKLKAKHDKKLAERSNIPEGELA